MLLYVLMVLAAGGLVLWVCHYDEYDPEPWPLVLLAVAIGFVVMAAVGRVENVALASLQIPYNDVMGRASVVAAIEEVAKLLAILLIAVSFRHHFNDPMDGLIYGRLAGLGMAVNESLLYLSLSPASFATLGAEIVRLFAHSLMGGIVGFAIGLGAHPTQPRRRMPRLALRCLVLSMLLHLAWNIVSYQSAAVDHHPWLRTAPMLIMLALMALWRGMVSFALQRSREIFVASDHALA